MQRQVGKKNMLIRIISSYPCQEEKGDFLRIVVPSLGRKARHC